MCAIFLIFQLSYHLFSSHFNSHQKKSSLPVTSLLLPSHRNSYPSPTSLSYLPLSPPSWTLSCLFLPPPLIFLHTFESSHIKICTQAFTHASSHHSGWVLMTSIMLNPESVFKAHIPQPVSSICYSSLLLSCFHMFSRTQYFYSAPPVYYPVLPSFLFCFHLIFPIHKHSSGLCHLFVLTPLMTLSIPFKYSACVDDSKM